MGCEGIAVAYARGADPHRGLTRDRRVDKPDQGPHTLGVVRTARIPDG